MKYIEKIKCSNLKRFDIFEYAARQNRNIFIGDNEAGKSTLLQAVDLVLTGSKAKVEALGLEALFNRDVINHFLAGDKSLDQLPTLEIELFLNDHGNLNLEGINNTERRICHGLKLVCAPMDDYAAEMQQALANDDALFPFEYYSIHFSTFSGQSYTQNRRFINHILIDSALIGTEYATRQYTKSLYDANTDIAQRHQNNHAYRQSKAAFKEAALADVNAGIGDFDFAIRNDNKANLELDLMITEQGIPVAQMGKGRQCFIKADFALQQRDGATPIDLILIEEPENHLSHINMKRLINRIEASTQTQIFVATHSNSVCSRLDLHNAALISGLSNIPVSLQDLPEATANYFIKAPDNKILEFILAPAVLLVEGDAEFMLLDGMCERILGITLDDANVHVVSVGGTSFKRYLDIAKLLNIKTAVVRDNDGDFDAHCVQSYGDYVSENIQVFYDSDDQRSTLEICIYQDNTDLCEAMFSEGRRTLSVQDYMLKNKTDTAFKLLTEAMDQLVVPDYIAQALRWINE